MFVIYDFNRNSKTADTNYPCGGQVSMTDPSRRRRCPCLQRPLYNQQECYCNKPNTSKDSLDHMDLKKLELLSTAEFPSLANLNLKEDSIDNLHFRELISIQSNEVALHDSIPNVQDRTSKNFIEISSSLRNEKCQQVRHPSSHPDSMYSPRIIDGCSTVEKDQFSNVEILSESEEEESYENMPPKKIPYHYSKYSDLVDNQSTTDSVCTSPPLFKVLHNRSEEDSNDSLQNDDHLEESVVSKSPSLSADNDCMASNQLYELSNNSKYSNILATTSTHLFVVAIDFGTTYSGYAFALTRQPDCIHVMRKWDGGDPGIINQKTPTTLLLTPSEEFHSFGFYARDFYHDLEPIQARQWYYFEKFKMHLHHTQELTIRTMLTASNGKKVNALKVFTYALAYFKDYAMKELNEQTGSKLTDEDLKWVITVPAIWRQPAKAFMRQAAYMAGIASVNKPEQLIIALEPEAASIYIRQLKSNQLLFADSSPHDINEILLMSKIVRYMVVDCGGGTVDITVHELNGSIGTLKELYKATGGPYGSTAIDNEFECLIAKIFSREFIDIYKLKRPSGFVDLMVAFEARKRTANLSKSTFLNIALPFSFIDYYRSFKGQTVESALKRFNNPNCKWSSQGMLRISIDMIYSLFCPVLIKVKEAISEVISLPSVCHVVCDISYYAINYMFLVGGFAESPILQQEIRNAFDQSMKIVIPQDVSLAILKGAVLYGLNPNIVNIRRSRLTYGVGIMHRFKAHKHPIEKLVVKDDQQWCADIFDKFVLVDQSVGIGDVVLRRYAPATSKQEKIIIHFYCSENDNAKFVSDLGVHRIGTLILEFSMPPEDKYEENQQRVDNQQRYREIQTRMVFGDTEIKVSALDVFTGRYVKAIIDFLNN
ncbi:hypothetical protein GJ496_003540 [Pomphorhynchus laevis]|nr:hypothetical protein GJ496_003540 [Pomphorhynchus laevis]